LSDLSFVSRAADQRTSCWGPLSAAAELDPAGPWGLGRSSSMMESSVRAMHAWVARRDDLPQS
jgi:hypothetical protein